MTISSISSDHLRDALEVLWTDMGALARNPLVDELGLVPPGERDVYTRGSALIAVLMEAAQRLKGNGDAAHFEVLNRAYGMDGARRMRHRGVVRARSLDRATRALRDVVQQMAR